LVLERARRIPGVNVNDPDGAFYVFLDVNERIPGVRAGGDLISDDVQLANKLLEEANVATVMGSAFEGNGCLRVSYAASEDTINTAFDRMEKFFAGMSSRA